MRTVRLIVSILILFMLAVAARYWFTSAMVVNRPHTDQAIAVTVAKVTQQHVPQYVDTVGTLIAKRQVQLASALAGRVVAVPVVSGQFVKKNTLLVQLDDRQYQAAFKSARAAYELNRLDYHRYLSLAREGPQSKQELDKIRAQYQQADALLKSSQWQLQQAAIKAPFAGTVGAMNVQVGDTLAADAIIATLTDRHILQANYQLPAHYVGRVHVGQKVRVSLGKGKQHQLQGIVQYVAPVIDTETNSLPLQAKFTNTKNQVTPGGMVRLRQWLTVPQVRVIVPESSIVTTSQGSIVYVVKGNQVSSVKVKTGNRVGQGIVIKKGLRSGQVVVTTGQQQLKDGSPIHIVVEK